MAFPTRDVLLVPYSTNFNEVLVNDHAAYGVTLDQTVAYSNVHSPYIAAVSALDVARANGTRSEQLTAARDTARDLLLGVGRELYGMVSSNTAVSNQAKIALGVNVRGENTNHSPPKTAPTVAVSGVTGRTVTVRVFDAATASKRGKARNAVGAWLYTYVGTEYPSDPSLWDFQGATTQYASQVTFANTLGGGTQVWVCASWINGKQQSGPPSLPVTTYLQGGGGVSAQVATGDAGMKIAA